MLNFRIILCWSVATLIAGSTLQGQDDRNILGGKLNLELQAALRQGDSDRTVDLIVRGDAVKIVSAVRVAGGQVKASKSNLVSVSLPASVIAEFADRPYVDFIEYTRSKPQLLNDVMIQNNNVFPVHAGAAPLPQAYLGEDVVIGLIDTGIELDHPDFQNADGTTRVIALWDQTQSENDPFRVPQPYGYGQEWTAEDIDGNIDGHDDQAAFYGHGSTVAGVAAGNARATGQFVGVAPKADIVVVSSDLDRENWSASVADAVDFIFSRAEAVGKPAVINISLGDYFGSHDALDGVSLLIESLISAAPGRVMVAAAGNSGNFVPYHLSYDVPQSDTAFTWMRYHPNSLLGEGAVFFELWADTIDFAFTSYTLGADLSVPNYEFRGYVAWRNAAENEGKTITDTLFWNGNILGIVDTWCAKRGGQYQVQVAVRQPFSSQYRWRFATTGGGRFDIWSHGPFGTSVIESSQLPNAGQYPPMAQYRLPDKKSSLVDAWACSEKVITVGNYINRDHFTNYLGELTTYPEEPGGISVNSSRGPTRDLRQKPDVAASGDVTLSAGRLATLNSFINTSPTKVAEDGWHYVNGGTSIASPVVAGIAALYLSRDPQADWSEVKEAIVENAVADPFTGALPNDQFGYGKVDAFATLTVPFVTSTRNFTTAGITVFPNPTTEILYIRGDVRDIRSVEVFDMSGRLASMDQHYTSSGEMRQVDVANFSPGVYLLKTSYGDGSHGFAKFVVGF